ncbi:hypothetical protein F5883DRAFT_660988 [Diaporthe sp. PMI_573]|nr:hypothetical protein F5883DRAFT_660988 [Diaporthaceae sp. PMI_573]
MALRFATYICPPILTALLSPDPLLPDSDLWSLLCCTLIYTSLLAVVVDCPPSIVGIRDLAAWIKGTLPVDCTLELFLATHVHGDYFFGFPVLEDNFPGIQAVASRYVVKGVGAQYAPELYEGLWKVVFPASPSGSGMPERRVDFKALPESNEVCLGDGTVINVYDIQYTDTHHSSFVYVADLDLVVAGDIIEAVSKIAFLEPKIVIPGHSFYIRFEPDAEYAKAMLQSNIVYITGFEEELGKASRAKELFQLIRKRFNRRNLWILEQSCDAAFGADALYHGEV